MEVQKKLHEQLEVISFLVFYKFSVLVLVDDERIELVSVNQLLVLENLPKSLQNTQILKDLQLYPSYFRISQNTHCSCQF